jgi:hypothetical protein
MQKWAVVACDQFNADGKYWSTLEGFVGGEPSALRLIVPEIYLLDNTEQRVEAISQKADEYLKSDIFRTVEDSFILVEREVEDGKKRIGVIAAVDLEEYDFKPDTNMKIRSTEATIEERLPIRVEIRERTSLETPHILLLIDDREKEVIDPLYARRAELEKLYDFELNMEGGRITGYRIPADAAIVEKLTGLLDSSLQKEKYGVNAGLAIAVGDGNHSLAAAKVYYEKLKETLTEEEYLAHPARYCLAEIVNIYCEAMLFEPIHRLIRGNTEGYIEYLEENIKGVEWFRIFNGKKFIDVPCSATSAQAIKEIDFFTSQFAAQNEGVHVEYVHGDEDLIAAVREGGGLGVFMPHFAKDELFNYVVNTGNLPKKAFSIGSAKYKRYYLEARVINESM